MMMTVEGHPDKPMLSPDEKRTVQIYGQEHQSGIFAKKQARHNLDTVAIVA